MTPLSARLLAVAAMAAFLTVAAASAVTVDPSNNSVFGNGVEAPPPGNRVAGSGTGLICIWAIQTSVLEMGRRCGIPRNPAFEAELERAIGRLEDYARRQSPDGAAFMANYRPRLVDQDAGLCGAEATRMYADMSRATPEAIRTETDRFLATHPSVEWGTCL